MAARPEPTSYEVESAFREAMAAAGYIVSGALQTDSKGFVRFDAPGDKQGRGNGFYKLKLGKYPVGWFGDWKAGDQTQWQYHDGKRFELTDAEKSAIRKEQARLKAEAAQERETRQAEVAEDASAMWGRANGNVEGHQYLERKGITTPRGLRIYTAKDGTRLLAVPMWSFDMNGVPQLTSLQMIDPNGQKRFLSGGRVEGCFFSIKGDPSFIVICEGVATAFAIWQATGVSVVAAFNATNLVPVAKDFARHRPLAKLIIAGDDDAIAPEDWADRGRGRPWENAGRKKAEAAAKAAGCRWIVPLFKDGQGRDRTDFNDLYLREGEKTVAGQVVGALRSVEAEDAEPGESIVQVDQLQDESWRRNIPMTSGGSPDGTNVEGVALYLANHRLLKGRLRYNQLTKEMELDGNPLEDYHVAEFRRIMHAERFKARKGDVQDEMEADARRNQFDPLVEYLQGLKWDGVPRLHPFFTKYMGAPESTYNEVVGRKSLIGAVARALNPGCKLDTMPILEGEQGTGKSTALRYLCGDRFFADHLPDFHSKDSFQQLQGVWFMEVAELNKMTKAEVGDVKQFLSRLVDKFRPPFGRLPIQVQRRTVFWGTINPEEGGYLKDPTGARRFWPVVTGSINLAGILKDRDQLWAEAVRAYTNGETWHITDPDLLEQAKAEQAQRREVHPWEGVISDWLLEHRYSVVETGAILTNAVKMPPEKQDVRASRQAGTCMRNLGWIATTERPDGGGTPRRVFYRPDTWKEKNLALPFAVRGPDDDTVY